MEMRRLGSRLEVSAIGLGCMGFSAAYGPADEDDSVATIQRALELGVTLLDTADAYGPFTNERLVGRVIRGRRDKARIATKFGQEFGDDGKPTGNVSGHPDYVRKALDRSLERLGIDTIDLYYVHRVDDTVPIEETFGALHDAVEAGKVRFLGISEAGPETIRRAHAVHPLTAVQTEYSLLTRDVEADGVLSTVRELGIGFVAYSPLSRGFLSAGIRETETLSDNDFRKRAPRFRSENLAKNLEIVDELKAIADAKGITPAQLAIAWVLAQGRDIVPIPGSKRVSRLEENLAAADVELSESDLAAIERVAPLGVTAGDRYGRAGMVFIGR
jgi:aryl-alcohol dehydrogenase-like predicted oxidoreductase